MKLIDFKNRIDGILEMKPHRGEELEVVVVTSEPSMGGRACIGVSHVSPGFDWEAGRLNITVSEPVVRKKEPIQIDVEKQRENIRKELAVAVESWNKTATKSPIILANRVFKILENYNGK